MLDKGYTFKEACSALGIGDTALRRGACEDSSRKSPSLILLKQKTVTAWRDNRLIFFYLNMARLERSERPTAWLAAVFKCDSKRYYITFN